MICVPNRLWGWFEVPLTTGESPERAPLALGTTFRHTLKRLLGARPSEFMYVKLAIVTSKGRLGQAAHRFVLRRTIALKLRKLLLRQVNL